MIQQETHLGSGTGGRHPRPLPWKSRHGDGRKETGHDGRSAVV